MLYASGIIDVFVREWSTVVFLLTNVRLVIVQFKGQVSLGIELATPRFQGKHYNHSAPIKYPNKYRHLISFIALMTFDNIFPSVNRFKEIYLLESKLFRFLSVPFFSDSSCSRPFDYDITTIQNIL